jgi:hypothetical protein
MKLIHTSDDKIDLEIQGAGDNENEFHLFTNCKFARERLRLKNTVKTSQIPMSDPRK